MAGLCHFAAALPLGPGLYPGWYFLLAAAAYGLVLPLIAVLHVRHLTVRASGALLGTISGTAMVAVGIVAAGSPQLAVPTLFLSGIWWWTIGKTWWETGVVPRWMGIVTMSCAFAAFALALASAFAVDVDRALILARALLGAWLFALAAVLWRSRPTIP